MSGLINKILHHGHGKDSSSTGSTEAQYNVGSTDVNSRDPAQSYDTSTSATSSSAQSGTSVGKFAAALTAFATGDKSTTTEVTGTSGLDKEQNTSSSGIADTSVTTGRSSEYETTSAPVEPIAVTRTTEYETTAVPTTYDNTATSGYNETSGLSSTDRDIGGSEYGSSGYGATTGTIPVVTGGATSSAGVTTAGYGGSDIHTERVTGEILPGPSGITNVINERDPEYVEVLQEVKQHGVDDHGL